MKIACLSVSIVGSSSSTDRLATGTVDLNVQRMRRNARSFGVDVARAFSRRTRWPSTRSNVTNARRNSCAISAARCMGRQVACTYTSRQHTVILLAESTNMRVKSVGKYSTGNSIMIVTYPNILVHKSVCVCVCVCMREDEWMKKIVGCKKTLMQQQFQWFVP